MNLEELEVYQVAMDIGERVWKIVKTWDHFAKDTIGKQFARAADSMAANISEGFGRFFYKENKQFGYYDRGSLYETKTWLTKAHNRQLVDDAEYESLRRALESVAIRLNNYIRSIGTGAAAVREDLTEWAASAASEEVNGGFAASIGADAPSLMTNDAATAANDAPQAPLTRAKPAND
jgi:four helix bundle protein